MGYRGATTILLEMDAGPEGVLLTETGKNTIVRDPLVGIKCQIPRPVPFSSHIPQILISFLPQVNTGNQPSRCSQEDGRKLETEEAWLSSRPCHGLDSVTS